MKKKFAAGQLEHNESRKTTKQPLGFFSDTFYHLVVKTFKTKQTLHRICSLGVFWGFFRGNKERAERAFLPFS